MLQKCGGKVMELKKRDGLCTSFTEACIKVHVLKFASLQDPVLIGRHAQVLSVNIKRQRDSFYEYEVGSGPIVGAYIRFLFGQSRQPEWS